ncbi:MAG: carbon-nitrogen hydrolase family protein [Phycisphaerales bacterium]|nr:carbon-nitrogen hydrolase family protein [Phycisphaerales bacterium]
MTPPQPPARRFRLAVLQPPLAAGQPDANRALIRAQIESVTGDGAVDIVVLPEIYDGRTAPADGRGDVEFLGSLARDYRTHVIGGSCLVNETDGSFNRCCVVHRDGALVGHYDKRVLFAGEARLRRPGSGPGVFDLDGIRVAVLICADAWHPETARELRDVADIVAIPVKSAVPTQRHVAYGRRTWHALVLTRAMENAYVVAASDWATGVHSASARPPTDACNARYFTCGATSIADPSHRPEIDAIHRTIPDGDRGIIAADIDLDALDAFRCYRGSVGLLPRSSGDGLV